MKRLLIIPIVFFGTLCQAQDSDSLHQSVTKKWTLGVGLNHGKFQDVKFSNAQYSGFGSSFRIEKSRFSQKTYWAASIGLNLSNENAKSHDTGETNIKQVNANFKYLKPLKNNFYIGASIDLLDLYLRTAANLGNNGSYYINGHHLFASLMHQHKLSENWQLQSFADLGILSFLKESTSFAYVAPQNALEDGKFSFQDDQLSSPFGYKYFDTKFIGNYLTIKTAFNFQYKKRISLGYHWQLRRFATVKSYPVTTGNHTFIFQYNFRSKKS